MIFVEGVLSQSVEPQMVDDNGLPVLGLVAATFPTVTFSLAGPHVDIAISLVDLAAITDPWTAGGIIEKGNGYYRIDLLDSCFPTGGQGTLRGEASNKHLILEKLTISKDLKIIRAALAGLSTGAGTGEETYKDPLGNPALIVTFDPDENRVIVVTP